MAESYNLCLDIGGTKVLGVVFNSKKEIVYRLKKKTKAGGDSSDNVEEVIINVVRELINTSGIKKSDIHANVSSCGCCSIHSNSFISIYSECNTT